MHFTLLNFCPSSEAFSSSFCELTFHTDRLCLPTSDSLLSQQPQAFVSQGLPLHKRTDPEANHTLHNSNLTPLNNLGLSATFQSSIKVLTTRLNLKPSWNRDFQNSPSQSSTSQSSNSSAHPESGQSPLLAHESQSSPKQPKGSDGLGQEFG